MDGAFITRREQDKCIKKLAEKRKRPFGRSRLNYEIVVPVLN
jgi:hypothetical protein